MFCFSFLAPYARTTCHEEAFLPEGKKLPRSLRSLGVASLWRGFFFLGKPREKRLASLARLIMIEYVSVTVLWSLPVTSSTTTKYKVTAAVSVYYIDNMLSCTWYSVRSKFTEGANTVRIVVLTLTHRFNAVRGHRTGSNNSGAESYLRKKTNKNRRWYTQELKQIVYLRQK